MSGHRATISRVWKELFYPRDLDRAGFLAFYAETFDTVELNFSFYRMPTAPQLSRLIGKAGPDCLFSLKAHQSLTHSVDMANWQASLAEYRAALSPLILAERLGGVLLQFPFSFRYDPDRRRYLDSLLRGMEGIPTVVELRNPGWYNNRVSDAFRERRVAVASLDLPKLRGLPPTVDIVTAPVAYIRFHGRNAGAWWGPSSTSRHDYLYSEKELASWIERVKGIARTARRLLVYFNNCQAPTNARKFKELLCAADLAS